jgi:hypothetical protein
MCSVQRYPVHRPQHYYVPSFDLSIYVLSIIKKLKHVLPPVSGRLAMACIGGVAPPRRELGRECRVYG